MTRVNQYYQVRFADVRALRDWATAVMQLAARPLGLRSAGAGGRAVVFVPLMPRAGTSVYGYLSDDACPLADGLAPDVQLDGTVLRADELPAGLTMLYGDGAEAEAYEHRKRAV